MKQRIEKILAQNTQYSRSQIKNLIKQKHIKVNNIIIHKSVNVDFNDEIKINDIKIHLKEYFYLALNKPQGYLCAKKDNKHPLVLDLIAAEYKNDKNIHITGRLDLDTEGLLIITNDGAFTHRVLSPKKHVNKTYLIKVDQTLDQKLITEFTKGVDIGENKLTKPATLHIRDKNTCELTITEGMFHQIKRMFAVFGYQVIYLKRICFGKFILPTSLKIGEYIEINKEMII
ncbi:16S rRNA pseudouridine516 synthase [Mycoplasmopsis mustelae]|uniref:Pseudouridine synthase n=1 Tax=Mycoplasmopsis mustelae TaxID=171289 RepID=A0A4R7UCG8_9BACT|nr:pseudouridine synthase [Mycoplasmopsis mustelae]TDV24107.1 16S rRNA pseudouridine516 synthase [Mycoplasmopsis mustelae]